MALFASRVVLSRGSAAHRELGCCIAAELADAAAELCRAGPPTRPAFLVRQISESRLTPADEKLVVAQVHRYRLLVYFQQNALCRPGL